MSWPNENVPIGTFQVVRSTNTYPSERKTKSGRQTLEKYLPDSHKSMANQDE